MVSEGRRNQASPTHQLPGLLIVYVAPDRSVHLCSLTSSFITQNFSTQSNPKTTFDITSQPSQSTLQLPQVNRRPSRNQISYHQANSPTIKPAPFHRKNLPTIMGISRAVTHWCIDALNYVEIPLLAVFLVLVTFLIYALLVCILVASCFGMFSLVNYIYTAIANRRKVKI